MITATNSGSIQVIHAVYMLPKECVQDCDKTCASCSGPDSNNCLSCY